MMIVSVTFPLAVILILLISSFDAFEILVGSNKARLSSTKLSFFGGLKGVSPQSCFGRDVYLN